MGLNFTAVTDIVKIEDPDFDYHQNWRGETESRWLWIGDPTDQDGAERGFYAVSTYANIAPVSFGYRSFRQIRQAAAIASGMPFVDGRHWTNSEPFGILQGRGDERGLFFYDDVKRCSDDFKLYNVQPYFTDEEWSRFFSFIRLFSSCAEHGCGIVFT